MKLLLVLTLNFLSLSSIAQIHGKPLKKGPEKFTQIETKNFDKEKKCKVLKKRRHKQEKEIKELINTKEIKRRDSFSKVLDYIISIKSLSTLNTAKLGSPPGHCPCTKDDSSKWEELYTIYDKLITYKCDTDRPTEHRRKIEIIIEMIGDEE